MSTLMLKSSSAMSVATNNVRKLSSCCCSGSREAPSDVDAPDDEVEYSGPVIRSWRRGFRSCRRQRHIGFQVQRLQQRVNGRIPFAVFQRVTQQSLRQVQAGLGGGRLWLEPPQITDVKTVPHRQDDADDCADKQQSDKQNCKRIFFGHNARTL